MILAFNKTRGSKQTFDSMKEFEMAAKNFGQLELLQIDYDPFETIDKIEVEEIKPEKVQIKPEKVQIIPKVYNEIEAIEILPKKLKTEFTEKYTVSTFRNKLSKFNKLELEAFINFDTRATIKNEAIKELRKRK